MRAGYSNLWGDTANGEADALTVVVRRIDTAGTEGEAVGARGIVDCRRPIVALRTLIVEAAIVEVAGIKVLNRPQQSQYLKQPS